MFPSLQTFHKRTTIEKKEKSPHTCNNLQCIKVLQSRTVLWRTVQRSQCFTALMEQVGLQIQLWRFWQLKRTDALTAAFQTSRQQVGGRQAGRGPAVVCPAHGNNTRGFSSTHRISFPCWNELALDRMNSQETSFCAEEWMVLFALGYEIHHKDSVQRKERQERWQARVLHIQIIQNNRSKESNFMQQKMKDSY